MWQHVPRASFDNLFAMIHRESSVWNLAAVKKCFAQFRRILPITLPISAPAGSLALALERMPLQSSQQQTAMT
jgi:hypothetical protein